MEDKGARSAATAFTIAIHAALAGALVLSVAWKSKEKPQVSELSAELFSAPKPAPQVEPPTPPPPVEKVEPPPPPPPPVQKTEVAAPPPEVKTGPSEADIALKAKQEKAKQDDTAKKKAETELAEKAKLKLEADRKRELEQKQSKLVLQRQADSDAAMRELQSEAVADDKSAERAAKELARAREDATKEANKLASARAAEADKAAQERAAKADAQAQAQKEAQRSAQEKASRDRGLADYVARIRNKVRGNIVYAQEISGNPEAVFEITQLPSGDVTRVQLRKSSGTKALDEAIERAIQKSSPLPKPESPDLFQRTLILQVKPNE
jgi:colicin import membrane protein